MFISVLGKKSANQKGEDRLFNESDFKKSTACSHCRTCVAVASKEGMVAVRDTKDSSEVTLQFSIEEWQAFVLGVKRGEFDF